MNGCEKLHDDCLDLEISIQDSADTLAEMRIRAYRIGKEEEFKKILAVLEDIKEEVEWYKDFLNRLEG